MHLIQVWNQENKMSTLHAELTDPYDRPASIPPDEPYVDLGLIG